MLAGTTAPSRNWAQNRPKRASASLMVIDRLARIAMANAGWAAVRNSSSRWAASVGSPWWLEDAIAKTIGSVPTRRVHWLTLADTSVPKAALVLSRYAYSPATSSSGASDASGATHWTNRN